jgi:hypothetical protein
MSPQAHDEAMAAKYHELDKARQQVAYSDSSLLSLAGAVYFYRGRQRVTDMSVDAALSIVTAEVAKLQAHRAANAGNESLWVGYTGTIAPYDQARAEQTLDQRPGRLADVQQIVAELKAMDAAYTGWSRFFLVTSSPGHIHSSMYCTTCRHTTEYGWLPQLSGKTEADAVKDCGPTLCTVCFPTAPTDWTTGKKITAAQAAKKVA